MSSLQSIMNLDDDQQDASSPMDKKDKDTTTPASGFRDQDASTSTPTRHTIHPSRQHSTQLNYTIQQGNNRDPGSTLATQQGKRPIETSTAAAVLPAASLGYGDSRRQSSTSVDSMDPHGYGSAASSSSVGGGTGSGGYSPNAPRRPMGTSPGPEVPVRLTPITGRVSRAKKGVPVHVCDQCNPPKTFTRAEHLRRHQLSHQKPQYPCTYPDCGRTFFRQDLLSRHELRHTQEGGDPSSPRFSDSAANLEDQTSEPPGGSFLPRTPFSVATVPIPNTRPSTPPGGSTRSAMSPRPESHDHHQQGLSPGHSSPGFSNYTLHNGIAIINQPAGSLSPSPEPLLFSAAPRRSPIPIGNIAQSLSPSTSLCAFAEPPELDPSWTSEDSYSTHSELPRTQRRQPQPAVNWSTTDTLLSAGFPGGDPHEISASGGTDLTAAPYYLNTPFSVSPHLASAPQPSYGPLLSEPMMASFAEEQIQLLGPMISGHRGIHQGQPSVRSSSPSISMSVSGQAADTLVTPAPLHRIEPMARVSRQKELAVGGSAVDLTVGVLGSDANIATWTCGSPAGAGLTSGPGLAGLHGGGLGRGPALARPTDAILNAVPSYIEIYWKHAHRALPIVHRPSFEMEGEEALRYAMAALATQHLNSMEDRIRGSQLHEYAWQEAKRCDPGNIQGMQALFLCEHFARFRGRRPLVRPSKAFESLYSRVSGQQSLVSSVTGGDCFPTLPSSFPSSLSSSTGLCSPSIPAWSPQSPEPLSASSAGQDRYQFDPTSHNPSLLFSPVVSFSPQQLSPDPSSTYDPRFRAGTHNFSIDNAFSFPFSSHGHGQSYSDSFSSQVVDHSLNLFDATMGLSATGFEHRQQKPHLAATKEQHWRDWLDAEAYRRLLAACFCLDHHAASYHQQPRAKEPIDVSDIPLTGPTDALWEAGSIDEWYTLLEAEPMAATPKYLPRLDMLRPEDVAEFSKLDQGIILCARFLKLENQQRTSSPNNLHMKSDASPSEDLHTPTAAAYATELAKADKYERAATLFSKSLVAPIASAYVALHHTPLHDLLAVSGDSWVFSQKVLDPPTFLEHQKRLKVWAEGRTSSVSPTSTTVQATSLGTAGLEGLSSAKAAIYAARTLVSFFDGIYCQGPRPYVGCISTYWAIYVSALIIWAYGHYRTVGGGSSSKSSSNSNGGSPIKGAPMSKEQTVNWLRLVAAIGQPEHLARVRGRREASAGVVSMVKMMLDADCVGGRSRLYVDATVVLRKLEEGVNFRYF